MTNFNQDGDGEVILPDLLRPGLRLVFCGTAPGTASARLRAYYAGPGNRFWPTLAATGLTPRLFHPGDYPLLDGLGIGLTDLAKQVFGNDAALPRGAFDPISLQRKLEHFQPQVLAFTSKRAAAEFVRKPTGSLNYGEQIERVGGTRLMVLPSPSGLARRAWQVEPWQDLARMVD